MNKASIIVDASKYIQELKQKVDTLNQDVGTSQNSSSPVVLHFQLVIIKKSCFV